MMTERLQISVLSAPLACIDRRALSQAWYSALHRAREPKLQAPSRSRTFAQLSVSHRIPATRSERVRAFERGIVRLPSTGNVRELRLADVRDERRAERSRLARDIERVFRSAHTLGKRASFTFAMDGKRVHVILQSRGDRVVLVAVCSAAARGIVAAALVQARYALAGRGIVLDAKRRAVSCS
ncbi:MAG: hypothetical protein JO302_07575 [Candidatus Eremiobacteraeota bacterium]|nr:hypothetical protein [Candidatus Eremiobacteraeota bacterium]